MRVKTSFSVFSESLSFSFFFPVKSTDKPKAAPIIAPPNGNVQNNKPVSDGAKNGISRINNENEGRKRATPRIRKISTLWLNHTPEPEDKIIPTVKITEKYKRPVSPYKNPAFVAFFV